MPSKKHPDIYQVVVISPGVNLGQDDADTSVHLQSFLTHKVGISSVYDD